MFQDVSKTPALLGFFVGMYPPLFLVVPLDPCHSVGISVGVTMTEGTLTTERAGGRGEGKLTALGVQRTTKPGSYVDGRGLMLVVSPSGSKSWILRLQHNGRRRDYGLGGYPDTSLAEARAKAVQFRKDIRAGHDVIALKRQKPEHGTFREAAEAMLANLIGEGKYSANSERIARSRLETYAYPRLGRLQLQSIDADTISEALRPIWLSKPETALRVRQLIIRTLRSALPNGYLLTTALANAVSDRLPRQPQGGHHRAMPYSNLPGFMGRLAERNSMGALALRFAILTVARSGEVRGADWSEIDLEAGVWTVPAARMKSGKEHRVALTQEALDMLERLAAFRRKGVALVFPSDRAAPLSDMTLTKVMRDMGVDYVPHGFRSTFRDWAAEQTSSPREVIEACMAHTVGSDVELAYKRTDFLAKRRKLMVAWGAFCAGTGAATVVPLTAARASK